MDGPASNNQTGIEIISNAAASIYVAFPLSSLTRREGSKMMVIDDYLWESNILLLVANLLKRKVMYLLRY